MLPPRERKDLRHDWRGRLVKETTNVASRGNCEYVGSPQTRIHRAFLCLPVSFHAFIHRAEIHSVRIVLDAMGGDYAPREVVRGAVLAARRSGTDGLKVILVGQEIVVRKELEIVAGDDASTLPITVTNAPDLIRMDDHAAQAARRVRQSSIHVGLRLVRDGQADAFLSAGNSGATMATAVLTLHRLPGVDRPAIGAVFPLPNGQTIILDVGANTDCQPRHLVDFAYLGTAYMESVFNQDLPRVGLLSNGEESSKGDRLVQETYPLLNESNLNFVGNVEGRDVTNGTVDVMVCDGFAGNIVLKLAEGMVRLIFDLIRHAVESRFDYKLAGLVLRPALRAAARRLDYREYGSAPLLGVGGLVFIAHGRSGEAAIASGIQAAHEAAKRGVLNHMTSRLAARPDRSTETS